MRILNAEEILISVIVPVYNVGLYLVKCIDSIISQRYSNLQIILVDDGSTDDSSEICDQYAAMDNRIEVIHKPNGGLVSARRIGLEIAQGEYIGFVDGDDYIEPDMYYELLVKLLQSGADFIHSGYYAGDGKKYVSSTDTICNFAEIDKLGFICENILDVPQENTMSMTSSIWSKLFRAELIKSAYSKVPDSQQLGEDVVNLCACVLEASSMEITSKAFYHYTIRESSLYHCDEFEQMVRYAGLYQSLNELFIKFEKNGRVKKCLDSYIIKRYFTCLRRVCKNRVYIEQYRFPYLDMIQNKKVVLYGAGVVGENYHSYLKRFDWCDIVGWIDKNSKKHNPDYKAIEGVSALNRMEYDFIVIAVKSEKMAIEISDTLCSIGIKKEKILWKRPCDMVIEET